MSSSGEWSLAILASVGRVNGVVGPKSQPSVAVRVMRPKGLLLWSKQTP